MTLPVPPQPCSSWSTPRCCYASTLPYRLYFANVPTHILIHTIVWISHSFEKTLAYLRWDDRSSPVASPACDRSIPAATGSVDTPAALVCCSARRTTRSARSCSRYGGRWRSVCRVPRRALAAPSAGCSLGNRRRTAWSPPGGWSDAAGSCPGKTAIANKIMIIVTLVLRCLLANWCQTHFDMQTYNSYLWRGLRHCFSMPSIFFNKWEKEWIK